MFSASKVSCPVKVSCLYRLQGSHVMCYMQRGRQRGRPEEKHSEECLHGIWTCHWAKQFVTQMLWLDELIWILVVICSIDTQISAITQKA